MSYIPSDCSDNAITCENSHLTLEQLFRDVLTFDANGCLVLRTSSTGGGGGSGDASAANQVAGNNILSSINGKDFATQTTLAAVLSAIGVTNGKDFATQTTLAAVLAKLNASIAVTGTFWQATQPVSVASDIPVYQKASAVDSGATNLRISNANDTGQVLKSSAGNLLKLNANNRSADTVYIKLYNKATAPTISDTPIWIITLPSGIGAHYADEYIVPIWFSLGISVRAVTGLEDSSTTSPTTNNPFLTVSYK